ncbi:MAG: nucleotidyltransferase family protein [Phycisphaerae bacterium]|nr:nucleotidyltransferase family protein [Gemmatimonadaceae bacterium]
MNIGAVILAAGASTRLGEPKQLLRNVRGETLVESVAQEALDAGASPVFVVVGASAETVRTAVQHLTVTVVENVDWADGMSSSIRAGVCGADACAVDAVLLLACDMPSVGTAHLRKLVDALHQGAVRVASEYGDTRGIPAVIRRAEFAWFETLTGDKGAKGLLMLDDTALVHLEGGTFDLDTPEDVATWRASE